MSNEVSKEDKESKVTRIKRHIRKNRNAYIAGAAGIAVGAVGMLAYLVKHGYAVSDDENRKIQIRYFEGFLNQVAMKAKTNYLTQTISVYGNKVGHPGYPVWDLTTEKLYQSQTLAAKAIGVSNTKMSDHLHGRRDHVNGHIFKWAE